MEPGTLLRAAREAAGVGLREIARRTHYSASYISLIESGKRAVPTGVVAAYERVVGSDLGRLINVAETPAVVDASALSDVAVMLSATRRIEDATGAISVLPAVQGMAAMSATFADQAHTATAPAAAVIASEVTQYRGWLEHAIGADAAARRSLTTAVDLAQHSGDPDRLAHSLGFLGYVTLSAGDYAEVVALSDAALAVRGAHPTINAYGRMRRAELSVSRGEKREAQRALAMADAALETSDGIEPPASMYWWTSGFAAVQRGGVLALLGHTADAVREATQGLAAMPTEHRRSDWLASALRRIDPDMDPSG